MVMVEEFVVDIADETIVDLQDRVRRARWPERQTVDDWSQGVPLETVQELCAYWAEGYDWTARQARLNAVDHFTTVIDGLAVHFVHVRSPHPDAHPLVLTHGWPGSFAEFLDVVPALVDPTAHGGRAEDAFHVVCPSLPGFTFSGKPETSGWGIERIADAWAELMTRLGYGRFGAQGGDWGAGVSQELAIRHPQRLSGLHLNLVLAAPTDTGDLTDAEQASLVSARSRAHWDNGYVAIQSTRPQTIGYSLTDSPTGLCAWILEKLWAWTDHDDDLWSVIDRDAALDLVTLYWVTSCGASAARIYWESVRSLGRLGVGPPVEIPTGCVVAPRELVRPSRRWADQIYRDIRRWTEPGRGGHFLALERPILFVDEVRAFFALVR